MKCVPFASIFLFGWCTMVSAQSQFAPVPEFPEGAPVAVQGAPVADVVITIQVEVPEGTGPVFITGSDESMGPWNPGQSRMMGEGPTRFILLSLPTGSKLEYKFTLGKWDQEALDEEGSIPGNHMLEVVKPATVQHRISGFGNARDAALRSFKPEEVLGKLTIRRDVASQFLTEKRHVFIWTPEEYDLNPEQRFPVLYMHDAQNLFIPRMSTTGVDWGVDETITRLAKAGKIPAMIVVGTTSSSERRQEYGVGVKAAAYARFMVEELKPVIDGDYRTLTDRENTFAMGSSMGGQVSLFMLLKYPEVFSKVGCLSLHMIPFAEYNQPEVTDAFAAMPFPKSALVYVDYGSLGWDALYLPYMEKLEGTFTTKGWKAEEQYTIRFFQGTNHDESAWRNRLETPFLFLFGTAEANS
jgi:enterochelin esterase-like enzyme